MRRKRGARRLKIRTDDINKTNIHTYFKSEEAPLCRIEFQLITTSHGNGISPKLSKNLHKIRQVGTLPAAKTSSVGNADTFPEREGIFAEWEHFLLFRFRYFDLKTEGELPAA